MNWFSNLLAMKVICASAVFAQASVIIDTVTIGNPDNTGDARYPSGSGQSFGAVDHVYNIGKYEVTAGQYAEFLNAVAATDTYGLYNTSMWSDESGCKIGRSGSSGSYTYSVGSDWADRPVNYVSWGDSARFSNWLHNGQPTGMQTLGTTEDGSYLLDGAISDAELLSIQRKPNATWAIPTEDEWYKAAYHKNNQAAGAYSDYPTSSDTAPSNALVDPDAGNNANFFHVGYTIGNPYWRTVVGEFENSASAYGTFDQGGNVWEWNEAIHDSSPRRVLRGGAYGYSDEGLHASFRNVKPPSWEVGSLGFRLSHVPEPSTVALLALGVFGVLKRQRTNW